jgi:hypothetical protein
LHLLVCATWFLLDSPLLLSNIRHVRSHEFTPATLNEPRSTFINTDTDEAVLPRSRSPIQTHSFSIAPGWMLVDGRLGWSPQAAKKPISE